MISKPPLVSIIIINYNGKYFLDECLGSLQKINFPKNNYEIIMVDNDSGDTSVEYTKKYYPEVKVIESKANLGFAGGCNLGVTIAKGQYIVFLNTDTKVEAGWLLPLVKRIESGKDVAAVNSKILSYFPFIEISIKSDVYMRSEFTQSINFQPVGVLLENVLLDNASLQSLIRYAHGFYEKEGEIIEARWTKGDAIILLPCDQRQKEMSLTMLIRSGKSDSDLKTKITIKLGDQILIEDTLESYEIKQYRLIFQTAEIKKHFQYAVQNSGVIVFKSGYARDRGAVVKSDRTSFYELDNYFYQKSVEINSFCGASVLIKKDFFEKHGGFDPSFFMYYEDVDLSLKFRRANLKIFYEPKSTVYHIHAGSSVEWSPLFTYNVEKNHLAVLVKHFPLSVFGRETFLYLILYGVSILKMIKWRLKENWTVFEECEEKVRCRTRVIKWIFVNFFPLMGKRFAIDRREKLSRMSVYKKLY